MAETTTTKQAAVWNPPRLRVLGTGVDTGNGSDPTKTEVWEGHCPSRPGSPAENYRMPTSGEMGIEHPSC